jgi:hypothetical protein
MTSLNLADNNVGQLVMSDGWQFDEDADEYWKEVEGEELVEIQLPAGEQLAIESPVSAIAIANATKDMRALTSLHVGRNSIPKKEMREIIAIAMRMDSMQILCEVPFKDKTLTELDVSGKYLGMEGALVVIEYLDGNGIISSVNLLKNAIPVEQAQELVKIMQSKEKLITLCGLHKEETELDFSGQGLYPGDAVLIANDISDMRGLMSLNLANNGLGRGVQKRCPPNFGHHLWGSHDTDYESESAGCIALVSAIKNNGAILSVNLLQNTIGIDQARAFASILKEHPTLKSLCGNSGEETELDMSGTMDGAMSGKFMKAEGAIMLALEIAGNGVLTSLNLSLNFLKAEGAEIIADAITVTNFVVAIILVPFSCPSDHWLNYCCLLLSTGYGGVDVAESFVEFSRGRGRRDYCRHPQGNQVCSVFTTTG